MAAGLDRFGAVGGGQRQQSHSFTGLPDQVVAIDDLFTSVKRQWVAGLEGRWLMPCASYRAHNGFDALTKQQLGHHTLAFNVTQGQLVERVDGPYSGTRVHSHQFNAQHIGETHHYRSLGPVEFSHLYFKQGLLDHVADTAGRRAGVRPMLHDDMLACVDAAMLSDLQTYMSRAASIGDPPSAMEMDARALVICLGLLERHSSSSFVREAARGGLAPWQLRRVCEAMQAQLDQDITLASLAAVAGLSSTHFCRAFKQSTGHPPFEWLLLQRIARAKTLLASTPQPLAEIALAVGFAAQPQFTTAFRRVTGTTPGAWRREHAT